MLVWTIERWEWKGGGMTKRLIDWLPLIFAVVALPFSVAALYLVLNLEDPVIYEQGSLDSEVAADVAARALDQAQQNNETAGTVLGLLEGGSVLLTVTVVLLAGTTILNIRDLREDLESKAESNRESIEKTVGMQKERLDTLANNLEKQADASQERVERELKAREDQLNMLTANLSSLTDESQARLDALDAMVTSQLQIAREEAEKSFRVLQLQMLAQQQVRSGNYDTAIFRLLEAYPLDPHNQTTNYLLGYLYTAQRRFEEASDYLKTALDTDPEFAPALAALGLAQRRFGDQIKDNQHERNRYWAEAETNLLRALDSDASLVDADGESYFGTLGGLYRRQKRYEDATLAYEQALRATPQSSYPVSNLATLYKHAGEEDKAATMFERVQQAAETKLSSNAGDHWARLDLAQAYLVLGNATEAINQYNQVITQKPSIGALYTALDTLNFLSEAPQPPQKIGKVIEAIQQAIGSYSQSDEK